MPPDDHRCDFCNEPAHAMTSVARQTHLVCHAHYKSMELEERTQLNHIPAQRPLTREEMVAELLEIKEATA